MDQIDILFRFLITLLASTIFGLERQKSHKPVGFGTYTFVAIGSCALAIISEIISPQNPLPLLGAAISGIGFLCAGAMIKTSDKIFGATTAASIWIFAVFGLVMGAGEFYSALFVYVFVWVIILIDRYFEKKNIGSYQKKITLITKKRITSKEVEEDLDNTVRLKLINLEVNKKTKMQTMVFLIEGSKEEIHKIPDKLYNERWFESFKVE